MRIITGLKFKVSFLLSIAPQAAKHQIQHSEATITTVRPQQPHGEDDYRALCRSERQGRMRSMVSALVAMQQ